MSEVQTVGVLRDAFALGMMALSMALVIYAWIRAKTGQCWNYEGNVLTRRYDYGDGLIALALLTLFAMIFMHAGAPDTGAPAPESLPKPDPANATIVLVINSLIMLGVGIALLVYLRFFRELSPAELFGLRIMKPQTAAGWAVVWVTGTYVLIILVMWMLTLAHHEWPQEAPQDLVKEFSESPSLLFKVVLAITAVFIAPLYEEIIFRGFFYGIAKRFTDRWFACGLTSLVFALVHHDVGTLLPLFLLAIGFSLAYEATGCLLVPMFMHALFNAWNVFQLAIKW